MKMVVLISTLFKLGINEFVLFLLNPKSIMYGVISYLSGLGVTSLVADAVGNPEMPIRLQIMIAILLAMCGVIFTWGVYYFIRDCRVAYGRFMEKAKERDIKLGIKGWIIIITMVIGMGLLVYLWVKNE